MFIGVWRNHWKRSNVKRYRNIIILLFRSQLNTYDVGRTIISHTTGETLTVSQEYNPDHVIPSFGNQKRPPYFSDLTPMEIFPWDFLKSQAYAYKFMFIRILWAEIKRCVKEIPWHLFDTLLKLLSIYSMCPFIVAIQSIVDVPLITPENIHWKTIITQHLAWGKPYLIWNLNLALLL